MLRRAIVEGIRFEYLLVDSWSVCAELLHVVHIRALFKCNFIATIRYDSRSTFVIGRHQKADKDQIRKIFQKMGR